MSDWKRESYPKEKIEEIRKQIYNDKNLTENEWNTAHKLLDEIVALQNDLASEQEKHRWIPVSERLPELTVGGAVENQNDNPIVSETYLVAVRRNDGIFYEHVLAKYWKNYGWACLSEGENIITFEELGCVVDYYYKLPKFPEPPESEE